MSAALVAPGSSCGSVPVEHLDYSFIQSCSDLKHLEKILRVLRSAQQGFYPHLIEFCERHIEKLDPRSRALRKEKRAATAADLCTEEWRSISEDLQMWERSIRTDEAELKRSPIFSDAKNLPPVRSSDGPVQVKDYTLEQISDSVMKRFPSAQTFPQRSVSTAVKTERAAGGPQPYTDWDRFDVEAECSKIDESPTNIILPERPTVKQTAISTALLRRATVHKHLGRLQESHDDLRAVLQMEPHNPIAQKLLADGAEQERGTGRKILIQEVEEEEDEEEKEEDEEEEEEERGTAVCSDALEAERGIMGHTHETPSGTDGLTHPPTGAPPPGHAHLEKHTQGISEHTAAESQLLKEEAERYTHCLQLHPECAAYTNRALCYIKLQRFAEARQDCDSALQLQPTNKKAFYRRALANKGLRDYRACRSDLQQVLRLDASVTEAEQQLMELTLLMKDTHPSGARRIIHITEVDDADAADDDDDEDDDDDDDEDEGGADGRPLVPQVSNVCEFGQVLDAARSRDDLLTCAELLRSIASERLPRLIGSQLDTHTLSFIIRALHTHLLHTHPELVFGLLQQLHTTHRFTMVLMMLGRDEHTLISQLFQNLRAVQTQSFSQNDITNLANKYI